MIQERTVGTAAPDSTEREGEKRTSQGQSQQYTAQGQAEPDGRKNEGDGQACIRLAGKGEIGEDAAGEEHG
ncbi:MAG: hypothetical protein ACRECF_05630 [Methyloceanibacter sp.]